MNTIIPLMSLNLMSKLSVVAHQTFYREEEAKSTQKNDRKFVIHSSLISRNHNSQLICGRLLAKIIENRERCSTVVLKLIDVLLSKNSKTVMQGLVYRFLNHRVCKQYGVNEVK